MLLGDFMQLGPVGLEKLNRKVGNALFTKWVAKDVFTHCRIASPAKALAHPKRISLDVQHRFGLDVMDLANRTAYDGLLKPGPGPKATGHGTKDDPQIVFLDTDGLGDLEQAYRRSNVSGWWAAGALLARAIAEAHAELGEAVGIVTPYAPPGRRHLGGIAGRRGDRRRARRHRHRPPLPRPRVPGRGLRHRGEQAQRSRVDRQGIPPNQRLMGARETAPVQRRRHPDQADPLRRRQRRADAASAG